MCVPRFRQRLGVQTTLGLTATATARTAASIRNCLRIPAHGLISVDLRRQNLSLRAEFVKRTDRLGRIRHLCNRLSGFELIGI